MAATPFFSVLMPTHLRPALLRRSLGSLRAQSFQDFEIIVVADAWDAESAAVAAELLGPADTFIKRQGKNGPATSRNVAMTQARGEWIVFLDDDDSFEPQHLATVRAAIDASTSPVLFTDCAVVTEDRTQDGMPPLSRQQLDFSRQDVNQLWVKNFIPNHALAYRRSLLEGISFDAHMASLEDWEFLVAVCARALPQHFASTGVVMHKDYVNPGTRRGTQETSSNNVVILDFLYTYRRWPAPTQELKTQRQALLAGVGLSLPLEWF